MLTPNSNAKSSSNQSLNPKLEFSPQETESGGDRLEEWISRDLRKPITGDSPPPPTYSQLFPGGSMRGEY